MDGRELLKNLRYPKWEELPTMELYMDQVITFLNEYLEPVQILNGEKKLTSSMVNNYVKHGIVDKPIKKKYNRTHLIYLYVVCFLKKIYSMDEILALIKIQVRSSKIEGAYIAFCAEIEKARDNLLNSNKMYSLTNDDEIRQLLQVTIYSAITTLYVESIIMEVKKTGKEKKKK